MDTYKDTYMVFFVKFSLTDIDLSGADVPSHKINQSRDVIARILPFFTSKYRPSVQGLKLRHNVHCVNRLLTDARTIKCIPNYRKYILVLFMRTRYIIYGS